MSHPGAERDKRAVRLQGEEQGRGGGLREWEGRVYARVNVCVHTCIHMASVYFVCGGECVWCVMCGSLSRLISCREVTSALCATQVRTGCMTAARKKGRGGEGASKYYQGGRDCIVMYPQLHGLR